MTSRPDAPPIHCTTCNKTLTDDPTHIAAWTRGHNTYYCRHCHDHAPQDAR